MPKLGDNMTSHSIGGSNFQFSATKIEALGASEYTLATVVTDVSGSVSPHYRDIEKVLKEIVKACRRSPRADNLMLRVVLFDDKVQEVHGFKPLQDINEADYDGCIRNGGSTALYDASYSSVRAAAQYGKDLAKQDYACNACVFVVTDGQDNVSKMSRGKVKEALEEARTGECLESIMSVLVGISTTQGGLDSYLQAFKDEAGFQQYVGIDVADEKTLAKLGGFISQSISSQSKALGTGGPSQSLTF